MQILVYVGGVMVLFLFVIMLVNVSAEERGGGIYSTARRRSWRASSSRCYWPSF